MSHVFTYGSLMFEEVWSGVVSGTYPSAAASLAGFRRQRVLGEDYPSLQRKGAAGDIGGSGLGAGAGAATDAAAGAGAVVGLGGAADGEPVAGILYFGVQAEDLAALDAFEGPEYCRIQVQVTVREQVAGGPAPGSLLPADTYLFTADDKVEAGPWDPREFERERIGRFLRRFPPRRTG